ncbi:glycosyltransferase 87 family protein [Curtobacterium sp. RRHDQ10]|uniref:glycosyltransferase 87 family protein n=1 Tax=Curtobacterium phyllosphaerae TaxID=3413379 RepID=UPI003BEFC9D2
MTAGRPSARAVPGGSAALAERVGVVVAFAAVHALLWWLNLTLPNLPLGDVDIAYRQWLATGASTGVWIGIDLPWVYPVVALVPMLVAPVFGLGSLVIGWLVLVTVLDAVAFAFLWRCRFLGVRVGWWWALLLLALGPIALGRIDTPATAIALVGVVWVLRRPGVAAALLTLAAWIKVWPAALVGVLLLLRRGHRRAVLVGAATVTVVVVAIDAVLGGLPEVLSFITQQTGRGLQIESPLATPFLWLAKAHVAGAEVYYDRTILTFQVAGTGTATAGVVSSPLMAVVVALAVLLALVAVRGGARQVEVMPLLALVLVAALLATNKVGSPQYVGWFAVPIVWGLVAGEASARRFLVPAAGVLVLAVATQLVYPAFYNEVLGLQTGILVVLTVRNVLEVAMLAWGVAALVRIGRQARSVSASASSLEARPT